MAVITLIGDLINSKGVPHRATLQRRLGEALQAASKKNRTLASPYTLTLGDEFQAVYRQADRVVNDLLAIMAAIHPVRARFALGIGSLSTDINPQQALGMDGPAFHHARAAMVEMKANGRIFRIGAESSAASWAPANHMLAYLGSHMNSWEANRFEILRLRLAGRPAVEMAGELGISKVAIHKNIRVAALDDVAALCDDLTAALTQALSKE